ncbi:MAG: hypothetical protein EXQ79_03325 [Acidimicrobiia bacterium]|nr:hypothetical protein [Acidimicrobiia bacterium]
MPIGAEESGPRAARPVHGAQQVRALVVLESTVARLGEDAAPHEVSQDPRERVGIGVARGGQRVVRQWPVRKVVGDAELRGHAERLRVDDAE